MARIGILNGGGDCAGLNAVLASVVKSAVSKGFEVYGIEYGFEGLLGEPRYRVLDMQAVRGITHLGGTVIYTTNKGRFAAKVSAGGNQTIDPDVLQEAKSNVEKLGLDYLIVVGGDGTLSGAMQLAEMGVKVVAVPKTIDNDLSATDRTFGFSSAVDIIAESLDRIHTTAVSHGRVMLVETMGRNAGWLALYGGIAGGADAILLPEFPFSYEKLANFLRQRHGSGRNYTVIAVAEGATAVGEGQVYQQVETKKENLLGGISEQINQRLTAELGDENFEMRNVVLGHLQRGGSPNAEDRILAQRFGIAAMNAVISGQSSVMVRLQGTEITLVPISEAVGQLKKVTAETPEYKAALDLGISFGN